MHKYQASIILCACGLLLSFLAAPAIASGSGEASPSFDCSQAESGSIEELICTDWQLAALDKTLAKTYQSALEKAGDDSATLTAGQRGWLKGRNECWKTDDAKACVENEYRRRTAELRARYRLVPFTGPVTFVCEGDKTNAVVVTFFSTEPATLIAEKAGSTSLMYVQRSASGARYEGGDTLFWEHQGEAMITWGAGTPQMQCVKSR